VTAAPQDSGEDPAGPRPDDLFYVAGNPLDVRQVHQVVMTVSHEGETQWLVRTIDGTRFVLSVDSSRPMHWFVGRRIK
jgi:hypothetical protein